ncbi:hypothetical protein [Paenibacillus massiliensis]|uniref:hypothetical protein n=1 Tax=Paenibacillus massiliensis TaxID=225917 RepID=UPI000472FC30|nr:hypothetical protein [Paenibacillus massiliensis]
MNLFEEISDDLEQDVTESSNNAHILGRPNIKKVDTSENIVKNLTVLAQFFLLPFETGDPDAVLHIPVFDEATKQQVLHEIGGHFENCKLVDYGAYMQIMLSNPREGSKEHLRKLIGSGEIDQMVYSLYGNKPVTGEYSEAKKYKVNLDLIQGTSNTVLSELWTFLSKTFIRDSGELTLLPHQWYLAESLKDNIAVQHFASVCNSMRLTVDTSANSIMHVSIK